MSTIASIGFQNLPPPPPLQIPLVLKSVKGAEVIESSVDHWWWSPICAMFVSWFFSGISRTAGGQSSGCSSATTPAKAEYCNLFFGWEHHLVDTYSDEKKKNVCNSFLFFFARMDSCVWMLCVRLCWNQVLFLKTKCFSFLFFFPWCRNCMQFINHDWTQVLPLAV